MNIRDHKRLAEKLMKIRAEYIPVSWWERTAFVLGNMEPDMNLFSYFRGFFTHTRMHGHNYENVLKKILCMIVKLKKKRDGEQDSRLRLYQFFLAGVMMHYAADAFTWPHNRGFEGNLRDHVLYELDLHRMWENEILFPQTRTVWRRKSADESWENFFVKLHDQYLLSRSRAQDDMEYIYFISVSLCGLLPDGKGDQNGCNAVVRRNYDNSWRVSFVHRVQNEQRGTCPDISYSGTGIDALQGSESDVRIFMSAYYRFFCCDTCVWRSGYDQ